MEIADIHLCCDFPPPLNGIAEVLEHGEMELRELRKAALRALRMCARGVPYEEAMRCPHVRQVGRHATVTFPSLLDSYAGNVTWGMVVSAHLSCAGVTFRVRDDCFPRAPAKGDRVDVTCGIQLAGGVCERGSGGCLIGCIDPLPAA